MQFTDGTMPRVKQPAIYVMASGRNGKKIALVEAANPEWRDLYPDIL